MATIETTSPNRMRILGWTMSEIRPDTAERTPLTRPPGSMRRPAINTVVCLASWRYMGSRKIAHISSALLRKMTSTPRENEA